MAIDDLQNKRFPMEQDLCRAALKNALIKLHWETIHVRA
jgi:hypothetical protein